MVSNHHHECENTDACDETLGYFIVQLWVFKEIRTNCTGNCLRYAYSVRVYACYRDILNHSYIT